MSKRIPQDGSELIIAPNIVGGYNEGIPYIQDNQEGESLNPNCLESKIKIYEREVIGWFLDPAKKLLEENTLNNSFIVIMICMSYIEGVEQYKVGESSNGGKSTQFFINSLKSIYPNKFQINDLRNLYSKTRCGLFHNGMVKGGVIFNNHDFADSLLFENDIIKINPTLLLNDLNNDFLIYLRNEHSII